MPSLTAIVVAGPQRERAERAIAAVLAQTSADEVEPLVVDVGADGARPLRVDERVRVLRLPGGGWGEARTAAVRAATGRYVAFVEDHCVPAPGWAAAVIRAHDEGHAVVGYAFTAVNPRSYRSRAGLLTDYGLWVAPLRRGPARYLPSNNVSYRRTALEGLEDQLATIFAIDFNLHEELRRRGHDLFLEPDALIAHENFERVVSLWRANHNFCRLLAANRADSEHWSRGKRIAYGAAAPLAAPAIKLVRLTRALRGRGHWREFTLALPIVVSTFAASAVGESAGYLAGRGDSERAVLRWEVDAQRSVG